MVGQRILWCFLWWIWRRTTQMPLGGGSAAQLWGMWSGVCCSSQFFEIILSCRNGLAHRYPLPISPHSLMVWSKDIKAWYGTLRATLKPILCINWPRLPYLYSTTEFCPNLLSPCFFHGCESLRNTLHSTSCLRNYSKFLNLWQFLSIFYFHVMRYLVWSWKWTMETKPKTKQINSPVDIYI